MVNAKDAADAKRAVGKSTGNAEPVRDPNAVSHAVIGAALKVHSALGAGVLESAVSSCLLYEFAECGLDVQHQVRLPVVYKNITLPTAYRVDFIVDRCVIVEIKSVERILPVHLAQLLSYLRLSGLTLGLLINFNVPHLRQGIRRVVNGLKQS